MGGWEVAFWDNSKKEAALKTTEQTGESGKSDEVRDKLFSYLPVY